jgi:hypothetical protein
MPFPYDMYVFCAFYFPDAYSLCIFWWGRACLRPARATIGAPRARVSHPAALLFSRYLLLSFAELIPKYVCYTSLHPQYLHV